MLDIKHYELICAIDEHNSLKDAASAIGLTQPAATYRLQEIEKRLAVNIYDKRGRKLVLLPAGERLLTAGKLLLPFVRKAEIEAMMLSQSASYIRWGVSAYDTFDIILKYLPEDSFDNFDIKRYSTSNLVNALFEREVDFIIDTTPVNTKDFHCEKIFDDELLLTMNNKHPLNYIPDFDIEEIAKYPYITYSRLREPDKEFDTIFSPNSCIPNTTREVGSISLILKILSVNQRYVSFLSAWAIKKSSFKNVITLKNSTYSVPCTWYIIYHQSVEYRPEIQEVITALQRIADIKE
ncbi:LysR family transcriptional regulator [Amphritea sp. 2_MG-2023]|uniref:LysR family transcriptional regulator n=1 Tax=Amphritea TaxID=515417 RepID=UPI001C07BB89|nr:MULTISPECIES: LysR family transcriptional regulator [Amphritea]MBU2967548.1 LysR family transcriptional regulator [Amphritea atlantica]MDO6419036.1 LysR family transcriptional regulator [Amphritea sp. 2_MG-2023]